MKNAAFQIGFNEETGTIHTLYDLRDTKEINLADITRHLGSYSYTLKTDDITRGQKPEFTTYVSREGVYPVCVSKTEDEAVFKNPDSGVQVRYQLVEGGLSIQLTAPEGEDGMSEFGLNLPLNFMSKINGYWENQFLVSSPYDSQDDLRHFCYFTRPDGKHLLAAVKGVAAGYKIDYSEYIVGHFFLNFKYLARMDRAFHAPEAPSPKELEVVLYPVDSYKEALEKYQVLTGLPMAIYEVSAGFIGSELKFTAVGNCDRMEALLPSGKTVNLEKDGDAFLLPITEFGRCTVTPYLGETKGLDCSVFGIDCWEDYYRRVTLSNRKNQHPDEVLGTQPDGTPIYKAPYVSIHEDGELYLDHNLCESEMWALSALRYMRLYGIIPEIAADVKNLLYFITAKNPDYFRDRLSLIFDGKEYTTYKSTRLQEAFSGVSILLDAWRLFGEREYLEYAVNAGISLMALHLTENGCILRNMGNGKTWDYTTVSCLVVPMVDLANELAALNDKRYHLFKDSAVRIADFMVERGLDFPTEGGVTNLTNDEMEDGSISCSALTTLYVYMFLEKKQSYLDFSRMIFSYHDAWTIQTHRACMYRSSLRWWETIWEGDQNGPALCCGHAWTIWRAEAEYYYALITKDSDRLLDSYNGYMTNFSTVSDNGSDMYSMYNCDYLCGGGMGRNAEEMTFAITKGFPKQPDFSLSRFVFARSYDSWFCTTAILGDKVLNGRLEGDTLSSYAPRFQILYVDGLTAPVKVKGVSSIMVRSPGEVTVKADIVSEVDGWIYAVCASEDSVIEISPAK